MTNKKVSQPNILWICTDQQRKDTLGCYGNPFVSTPHLDAMATESAVFDHAICQSPVCTPSRGSFMTGRYPTTSRTRQNGADIPDSEVLVTKILRDAGYRCGLSGKLHLSACNPESGCVEMERRIDDGYEEFHWSHDTAPLWGLHNEYYLWLQETFGTTYSVKAREDSKWVQDGMPKEQHQTTWCAQKAIDFIERQAENEQPWLFSVNIYDPHHAFDPPKEYLDRYLPMLDQIPLPNYYPGEEKTKPLWQQQDHRGAYNKHAGYPYDTMSEYDHKLVRAAYWAMCDLIDDQVGRMLEALSKTGQLDNTIVLFMSDHGELLGDHGIYLKGPFFYEPSINVPLLIRWPKKIPAMRYSSLVALMDLPQTLLELCGISAYEGMQGKSMASLLLEGQDSEHRPQVFCEYMNAMPWHTDPKAFASMVRTNRWKLVVAHSIGDGELYDLEQDPDEQNNLFQDRSMLETKMGLMELLLEFWASTVDPVPVRKSDW